MASTDLLAAEALAAAIASVDERKLAPDIRRHAAALFINWMGCVLGGHGERSVEIAHAVLVEQAGAPAATVWGSGVRVDVLSAALMNSLSASGYAFNEAHPQTSIHPVGPSASTIVALSERMSVTGREACAALLSGVEAACRLGLALIGPGSGAPLALSPTGLFGGFAAAAAASRILGLDAAATATALGIAAMHGGGYRESSGSPAGNYVPGHTARDGLLSALLAQRGYDCTPASLDGRLGFAACISDASRLSGIADGYAQFTEARRVSCKPYPCGMWIMPVIDVALDLHARAGALAIENIVLHVNPQGLAVTGRHRPQNRLEALTSMPHWFAVALVKGRAGVAEGGEDCIFDPVVRRMADRIELTADEALQPDQARVVIRREDGSVLEGRVDHCRGGPDRPMTDAEVAAKFMDQVAPVMGDDRAAEFLAALWEMPDCDDVAALIHRHVD